jgi:PAS domain S-box-containing protein
LLVQSSPLGVIEWDLDYKVIAWNYAAERIFGYSSDEAMGRPAADLIVPEEKREHVDLIWRALLKQKGGARSTNDNVTKEGRRITCEWYNAILINEDGLTIGVASLVDDITERMRVEKELKQHLDDLERFNRLVMGREEKMIQLKEEINDLRQQMGRKKRYNIVE